MSSKHICFLSTVVAKKNENSNDFRLSKLKQQCYTYTGLDFPLFTYISSRVRVLISLRSSIIDHLKPSKCDSPSRESVCLSFLPNLRYYLLSSSIYKSLSVVPFICLTGHTNFRSFDFSALFSWETAEYALCLIFIISLVLLLLLFSFQPPVSHDFFFSFFPFIINSSMPLLIFSCLIKRISCKKIISLRFGGKF